MTVQEIYDWAKATIEGDPNQANESVMVGMRSLKDCRQRCLLELDQIDYYGETPLFLVEDRT